MKKNGQYIPDSHNITQNKKKTTENIKYNSGAVGTYKVYVYGYSSAYSATKCYTLLAQTSGIAFRTVNDVEIAKLAVAIYPQPATDNATIQFNENWKGATTITIINQIGNVISNETINVESNGAKKLSLSKLNNGIYFIRITNGKNIITQKLLIQK